MLNEFLANLAQNIWLYMQVLWHFQDLQKNWGLVQVKVSEKHHKMDGLKTKTALKQSAGKENGQPDQSEWTC